MIYFKTIFLVIYIKWGTILPIAQAGFGTGQGTDPFRFGNVAEFCKTPVIPLNLDPTWTSQHSHINVVMMSKEYLTRTTQYLYNSTTVPHLTQSDLNSACFLHTQEAVPGGSMHTLTGYRSKSYTRLAYPIGFTGFTRFDWMFPGIRAGGIRTASLTNNVSFILSVVCYDDGVTGWRVETPNCSLTKKEIYAIQQHLLSLGFDQNNFIMIDFSNCAQCL